MIVGLAAGVVLAGFALPSSATVEGTFAVHASAKRFDQAVTACARDGAVLAPLLSEAANDQLAAAAAEAGVTEYWVGGQRRGGSCQDFDATGDNCWEWLADPSASFCDGFPNRDSDANCDAWNRKEPNNFLFREKCVRASSSGRWNDADCNRKHPYACYFAPTTTVTTTTTVVTTTTTVVTTTTTFETTTTTAGPTTTTTPEPPEYIPAGWSNYGNCFYKLFDEKKNFFNAKDHCRDTLAGDGYEAFLFAPTTMAEAEFVSGFGTVGKPRWTGGIAYHGEGFEYQSTRDGVYNIDFLIDEYQGWYDGEPNAGMSSTRCVAQGLNRRNADKFPYRMNDASCMVENQFVCQWCFATTTPTTTTEAPTTTTTVVTTTTTEAPTTTTVAPTTYALPDSDWDYLDHTMCFYKESDVKLSYDDALDACKIAHSAGGSTSHLASISSETEAMFVAGGRGDPRWVGVYKNSKGVWSNVDATFFSMSRFYEGEPNEGESVAQMGFSKKKIDVTPWLLNDAKRSNRNIYVCEWCPPEVSTSTTTEEPTTTTTIVTSTTTEGPTSTTTDAPSNDQTDTPATQPPQVTDAPCPAGTAGLESLEGDLYKQELLAQHLEKIAEMNSRLDNRINGKTFKAKWDCPEYCAGLAWGASCAPCPLSALKTEDTCLFSGPFMTGELCHRNSTTGEVSSTPCCNKISNEAVADGMYDIGRSTTCVIGNNCKCGKFGDVVEEDIVETPRSVRKFEASYAYTLPRKFEAGVCAEI